METLEINVAKMEKQAMEEKKPPRRKVDIKALEEKASLLGGTGLAAYGVNNLMNKQWLRGAAFTLAGGYLTYCGRMGRCGLYEKLGIRTNGGEKSVEKGVKVKQRVVINRPRAEVFNFWRNFEYLPNFMKHLLSVKVTGKRVSHWVAKTPTGKKVEWDSEITEINDNELIRWHSLAGSDMPNEGQVTFQDTPRGGTEITVELIYYPHRSSSGSTARLLNFLTGRYIKGNLNRFKSIIESGEAQLWLQSQHVAEG